MSSLILNTLNPPAHWRQGPLVVGPTNALTVISSNVTNQGCFLSTLAGTVNDNVTAASTSSAFPFHGSYLGIPTLTATNTGVVTPTASTLTIAGPPVASTNQTITNPLALNILNGNVNLNGGMAFSNGTYTTTLLANAALVSSYSLILPSTVPSAAGQALVSDTSGNLSWANAGIVFPGFRNLFHNGAMRIDQRAVGTQQSVISSGYVVDRWSMVNGLSNTTTVQQMNATPPPGFTNYANWTNSATASTNTTQLAYFKTSLEGIDLVRFGWSTTDAQNTVVSFWVNASVAGRYSFVILNPARNYSFVNSYAVNTANTWQKVAIQIPPPPGGAPWLTGFFQVFFGFHGSTKSGQAAPVGALGTWSSVVYLSTSDMTNLGLTANSTFNLTGVQWEGGSAPTAFEHRPWQVEMQLCQRFFEKSYDYGVPAGNNTNTYTNTNIGLTSATAGDSTGIVGPRFLVTKNSPPLLVKIISPKGTMHNVATWSAPTTDVPVSSGNSGSKTIVTDISTTNVRAIPAGGTAPTAGATYLYHWTADAEN